MSDQQPVEGIRQKIFLMFLDKFFLAVAASLAILVLQDRLQIVQERLAKARKLADLAVDRPLAIAAKLPGHVDKYIQYVNLIYASAIKAESRSLTELQANIDTDLEGTRAFYRDDQELSRLGESIRKLIVGYNAKALTTSIGQQDLDELARARRAAYDFQSRVVTLSRDSVLKQVHAAFQ